MRHDTLHTLRRIADACFPPPSTTFTDGLAAFQRIAVDRIRLTLATRSGAILADSVGLGKTHIAMSLIRMETAAGGSTLVTAPPALRSHWHRHLRGISRWTWLSHTSLSRMSQRPRHHSLVVADEAHAFRNPNTRRYNSLALACENARVLLVTATPVNNSLDDFYHLLRLFAPDDLFADIGVPDLRSAFDTALDNGRTDLVQRVATAVMIRRTRASLATTGSTHIGTVTSTHAATTDSPPQLRFPAPHAVETIAYRPAPAFTRAVRDAIPSLHFAAHTPGSSSASRELMRLGLLKRLESGTPAFRTSIARHLRLLDCFTRAAHADLLFDATLHQSLAHDVDGALQLSLESLVLPRWPASLDRTTLLHAAQQDMAALRSIAALLPSDTHTDPKLARLHSLLDELRGESILIFTEYRDTATAIWRSLARHPGVALIHGSRSVLGQRTAARLTIIDRFAPVANGARIPHAAQRVTTLITTDVLAEGLNLQDARIIISFDLPWNPVRLAQRIGRIDRLGSPHQHIRALAFVPDHGLDEMLRLRTHIRNKLRQIRIVGGDAPAFRSSTRRISARIDHAALSLEQAHAALARATAAHPSDLYSALAPPYAAIVVDTPQHASLCCFVSGRGTPLLVYQTDARPPAINTPSAWLALAHAAEAALASDTTTDIRSADVDDIITTARAALDNTPHNRARARHDTAARSAATSVMKWLASRPGGASREDISTAEAILLRLAAHSRAGQQFSLRTAIHTPPHRMIPELRRILDSSPEPAYPAAPHTSLLRAAPDTEIAPATSHTTLSPVTPRTALSPASADSRSFSKNEPTLVGVLVLVPRT